MNCAKHKWLEEVKVIFFWSSERLAAFDTQVQEKINEIKSYGADVLDCKWCSDRMSITPN